MMSLNPHSASNVSRNCEIIERSARAQLQLIEDLLDNARIISGKLKLDLAQADMRKVLEEAVEVVRPAAEIKQIELASQIDEAPRKLLCDVTRLRQVVWNLLQNAIKFTPEGGLVALRVERGGGRVRLIVSDTGRGIEPHFLPSLFDRFSQNDMSRSRRHGGLGLGLALVKQLVEMHGGTIEATCEGAEQGATFTVTLPLNAPQVDSHKPPPAIAEMSAGPAALPPENLPRLDGMRAMVVDDQ
jgi:signal transduction histidine kinase